MPFSSQAPLQRSPHVEDWAFYGAFAASHRSEASRSGWSSVQQLEGSSQACGLAHTGAWLTRQPSQVCCSIELVQAFPASTVPVSAFESSKTTVMAVTDNNPWKSLQNIYGIHIFASRFLTQGHQSTAEVLQLVILDISEDASEDSQQFASLIQPVIVGLMCKNKTS